MKTLLSRAVAIGFLVGFAGVMSAPLAFAQNPDSLSETYKDWIVTCTTSAPQDGQPAVQSCEMTQEQKQQDSGQRVLAVALRPSAEAGGAEMTLVLPFGLKLAFGVQISVADVPMVDEAFKTCLPAGCIVQTTLSAEVVTALLASETATISMTTTADEKLDLSVSLQGFGAAWARLGAF
jgi:invasion protein IalB